MHRHQRDKFELIVRSYQFSEWQIIKIGKLKAVKCSPRRSSSEVLGKDVADNPQVIDQADPTEKVEGAVIRIG